MANNILLLISVFIVAGSLTFLLRNFFNRLKRIEKEMWEEKAKKAKVATQKRKEQAAQSLKDVAAERMKVFSNAYA